MIAAFFAVVAALSVSIAAGYEGWGRYFEIGGEVPQVSIRITVDDRFSPVAAEHADHIAEICERLGHDVRQED